MKMKLRHLFSALLLLTAVFWISGTADAKAASSYQKIYGNFLEKGTAPVEGRSINMNLGYFTLLDIDQNGVKELLVGENEFCWDLEIYTIRKNKMVYIGSLSHPYVGALISYNQKYKGLVTKGGGTGISGYTLTILENNKLKTAQNLLYSYSVDEITLNGRKISKSEAEKTEQIYFTGKDVKEYPFYQNTPANRKQRLKGSVKQKKKVTSVKIKASAKKVKAGKKLKLTAVVRPKNASNRKIKWSSGNKKYATVTSKGVVKTKKAGKGKTVKITAKAKDGSGKKATIRIKIR